MIFAKSSLSLKTGATGETVSGLSATVVSFCRGEDTAAVKQAVESSGALSHVLQTSRRCLITSARSPELRRITAPGPNGSKALSSSTGETVSGLSASVVSFCRGEDTAAVKQAVESLGALSHVLQTSRRCLITSARSPELRR